MIIECPICETKVDGKIIVQRESQKANELNFRTTLLECPICRNPILVGQEFVPLDPDMQIIDWDEPIRLWPSPENNNDFELPKPVRASLQEARLCYRAGAYSACAVMLGRTLEEIAKQINSADKLFLAEGLKDLLKKGVIDKRIYLWGEELRKHRNIGAHATDEQISKEDAKDLLDFAEAICNYIFLLTKKFERFMGRKNLSRGIKNEEFNVS